MSNDLVVVLDAIGSEAVLTDNAGTPGPKGLIWCGAWSVETTYHADDAVSHEGAAYICVATTTGDTPANDSEYWDLLAAKGTTDGTDGVNADAAIGIHWNGNGQALEAGLFGYARVPNAGNLNGRAITCFVSGVPASGTATVHVEYAAPGATLSFSQIDGGGAGRLIVSSAQQASSTDMSAWTVAVAKFGVLKFVIDSIDGTVDELDVCVSMEAA